MKHTFRYILGTAAITLLLALPCGKQAQAQTSTLLYSSTILPHGNSMNPAFFPNTGLYLALPSLNMDLGMPISYSELLQYDPVNNVSNINLNNIANNLMEGNSFSINPQIYALGLGIKLGNSFLTASAQVKGNINLTAPAGLLTFLNEGNMNYLGEGNELELISGNLLNVNMYAEAAVGFGHKFDLPIGELTAGIRLKALDGLMNLSTSNTYARLYTKEDLTALRANLYYQINTAGMMGFDANGNPTVTIHTTDNLFDNMSFGVDFGARWETDNFDISFSVLDLGTRLNWNQNVMQIVPENGETSFTFEGIDASGLIQGGKLDTSFLSTFKDTLMSMTNYVTRDGESYWTSVPTRINLGAFYKVGSILRVGAVFHGEIDRQINSFELNLDDVKTAVRSNITLMANVNIFNWLEVMVGNSIVDDGVKATALNPSIGIAANPLTCIQAYFLLDYISNIYLVDARRANLTLGVSLSLPQFKNR